MQETEVIIPQRKNEKAIILFYHKTHAGALWGFSGTDRDFASCRYKCVVTSNLSMFSDADLVLFQGPRAASLKGSRMFLQYYR